MGTGFGISCIECGYSKDFFTGVGMMYSLSNLIDFDSEFALLPEIIRSKKAISLIKELLNEKNAIIAEGYGNEVYNCSRCGELYGRFFIHLDYDGGNYEVEYKCTKCKIVLKKLNGWAENRINLEQYPCPKCGELSLFISSVIDWD